MPSSSVIKIKLVEAFKQGVNSGSEKGWEERLTTSVYEKACKEKNWKRTYKGRGYEPGGEPDEEMIRIFALKDAATGICLLEATVTCDAQDKEILSIEFEQQS